MEEENLGGQTNNGVVRIGNTVHRKMGPWSPAVHAHLKFLESINFKYSPRFLGKDDKNREILSYFEGQSGKYGWARVVPEEGLIAFAKLLRSYHDAIRSYKPINNKWAFDARPLKDGEVICHGDFGPWNVVWDSLQPIGIVDWDFAHPAPPLFDVAYALEYVAPFRDDEECVKWLAYPKPPDRRRRLDIFAHAYGLESTTGLVGEVIAVQRKDIENVRSLANKGQQPHAKWVADGFLDELAKRVEWSEANRHLFE